MVKCLGCDSVETEEITYKESIRHNGENLKVTLKITSCNLCGYEFGIPDQIRFNDLYIKMAKTLADIPAADGYWTSV